MRSRAFTLIELLVVISIIGLLLGILLPSLAAARESAKRVKCLSNMRSMELASVSYAADHKGALVDVGLAHGGTIVNLPGSFITTLADYYATPLLLKSPGDNSRHWPADQGGQGVPLPGTTDQYRRTSYGINSYLTSLGFTSWQKIEMIRQPTRIVQFLMMAEEGDFAGSDHVHPENWNPRSGNAAFADLPPTLAAQQMDTSVYGGKPASWDAKANYGFLDGHAATLTFRDVFVDIQHNQFDPGLQ